MKFFAIGDGDKRISCPDHYCADFDGDDTTILWDPENVEMPIRVTMITVTPKDKAETEAGFWHVIRKAQEDEDKPLVTGKVANYWSGPEKSSEEGYLMYFCHAGLGNHVAMFSLTVPEGLDGSSRFQKLRDDLSAMAATMVEREKDQQFSTSLLESDRERIEEALRMFDHPTPDLQWTALQRQYDTALSSSNRELAAKVGLVFGELMRNEVPTLTWSVKNDEWGRSLALDLGDTGASSFPEEMVLKRFDRQERVELRELAEDTFDALENILRQIDREH
jgi:hypothetical protein